MKIKFSEDVIPLTDLKINPGKVVNQTKDTHRPILLTSRGRGVAVMQGLDEYEKSEEEREFIKASLGLKEREREKEEKARAEKERTRRRIIQGVVIFSIFSLALAGLATTRCWRRMIERRRHWPGAWHRNPSR